MVCRRGDVVLVPFPYTDQTGQKVRPAVVVSGRAYHNEQPDVILAALTSNIASAVNPLDYVIQDWQSAGLRFATAFKPAISTIAPGLILHKVGRLSETDMAEITTRLRMSLDL